MSKFKIVFYINQRGDYPVYEYIQELGRKHDKRHRIIFDKISDYLILLSKHGTQIGEPYLKLLKNEIWELRPLNERILFAVWNEDSFIILHQFIKKTNKTPQKEIATAKRRLLDSRERQRDYE